MPDGMGKDKEREIISLIERINDSWTRGEFDALEEIFHNDMVIAKPGFGRMGVGKSACVDSYRGFYTKVEISDFEGFDYLVDIWEDTAVVSYGFRVKYTMEGREREDEGHDIFVFSRKEGRWQALWRTLL